MARGYFSILEAMEPPDIIRKPRSGGIFAVRYMLSVMLFLSCFLVYAMRLNLSVSIVAMVNNNGTSQNGDIPSDNESCRATVKPTNETESNFGPGEFDWGQDDQAMIIYAFYVGYLFSQIPGGFLAERYSAWVLGLGVGLTGLLTSLTSVAARNGIYTFVFLRVLEGICEGVIYPGVFAFVAYWVPVEEQSFLLNFILSGSVVGTVVTMPLAAMLCKSSLGWPASFYIFGIIGVVWAVVWFVIATDSPEKHRWISEEEREYIISHRPQQAKDQSKPVPWKQMLLSPPVLLLGLTKLGACLNFYMILTELPSYLNYMYGIRIDDNGYINGGMNLGLAIAIIGTGVIVDKLITKNVYSKNFIRKFFVACSTLIPSACLCIIVAIGCNYDLVLGILLINCVFIGFMGGGDTSISLDLAPRYAGTLQGIVNLIANIAGVVAPLLVGQMTDHQNTLDRWNLVFLTTAALTTICSTTFLIFGTTDEQPWNSDGEDADRLVVVPRQDQDRRK